jgi:hypothetical protein
MPPIPPAALPADRIERVIVLIRSEKVILDADIAALYGVSVKRLNEAVRRNRRRFPADFMVQVKNQEVAILKSQFATSRSWGGRRTPPNAFTEQGVAMLSSVLRSERAIDVNIEIMRAFVRLRQLLSTHRDLAAKLAVLEKKYDGQFKIVFEAIRQLMTPDPPPPKRKRIGFRHE